MGKKLSQEQLNYINENMEFYAPAKIAEKIGCSIAVVNKTITELKRGTHYSQSGSAKNNTRWLDADTDFLRENYETAPDMKWLCQKLQRSAPSIQRRAEKMDLKFGSKREPIPDKPEAPVPEFIPHQESAIKSWQNPPQIKAFNIKAINKFLSDAENMVIADTIKKTNCYNDLLKAKTTELTQGMKERYTLAFIKQNEGIAPDILADEDKKLIDNAATQFQTDTWSMTMSESLEIMANVKKNLADIGVKITITIEI